MSEKPKFHSRMIKDGRWTVAVSTGYGPVSHAGNFATEEEANCQSACKFDPVSASNFWTPIPRLRGSILQAE
jgi:hypothetical protein